MPRFIDLVAIEGPERGMRYSVEDGTYRVIGRAADDVTSTAQLTREGDRALDASQEALVDELFARRASPGERSRARRRGADVPLHDGSVSRSHAIVFVDRGRMSVADLMSTNGTRVNGAPIRDVDLAAGDIVHVGKTKLRVEEG